MPKDLDSTMFVDPCTKKTRKFLCACSLNLPIIGRISRRHNYQFTQREIKKEGRICYHHTYKCVGCGEEKIVIE